MAVPLIAPTPTAAEIRGASLRVLEALGIFEEEMEVALGELDYLVELAQRGEVEPIVTSDPSGGFGSLDRWAVTVVPAVAALLNARRAPAGEAGDAGAVVAEIVARSGSPRARAELSYLQDCLRRVLEATAGAPP